METINSITQPKKKVKKFLLFGILSLIVILFLSHWIWKSSGSNQWELERDEKGVKIYTLKSPGSSLIKVKAIRRVQSKLAGLVKLMADPDSCDDVGCYESKLIERIDSLSGYFTFRIDLPFPFDTREFVTIVLFSQTPQSKKYEVNIIAAPNKIPRNECCVRVTHMHNIWRFTPLENGEFEVEYILDFDAGGSMPYFLANLAPDEVYTFFLNLQEILNKEKFQNAKLDYVKKAAMKR